MYLQLLVTSFIRRSTDCVWGKKWRHKLTVTKLFNFLNQKLSCQNGFGDFEGFLINQIFNSVCFKVQRWRQEGMKGHVTLIGAIPKTKLWNTPFPNFFVFIRNHREKETFGVQVADLYIGFDDLQGWNRKELQKLQLRQDVSRHINYVWFAFHLKPEWRIVCYVSLNQPGPESALLGKKP